MNEMPVGRRTPVVGVLDGKAIVIGGENAGQVFDDVREFDPADNSWRQAERAEPTARHGAAGGVIGDTVYVVGGSTVHRYRRHDGE